MKARYSGIDSRGIPPRGIGAGIQMAGIKPQGIHEPKRRLTKAAILRAFQNGADYKASADALMKLAANGNTAALGFILDALE